jgi:hypothetical protein
LIMKLLSHFKHLLFSYYYFDNAQLALQRATCVLEFSRLKNDKDIPILARVPIRDLINFTEDRDTNAILEG